MGDRPERFLLDYPCHLNARHH